jgi:hypothetical protein
MTDSHHPKKRGRPHCITDKQRVWINEYLIDMNGARAARVAGYGHPDVAAARLLNPNLYPLVVAELKKALARKELVAERKADDVLRYIHTAMFFCPADHFDPGGKGGWLISQEDYRGLPQEVRCLIEEMETRTIETESGSISTLWVRFVSKTQAMALAAKHQLGEKIQATVTQERVSWNDFAMQIGMPELMTGGASEEVFDPIGQVEGMPASQPTTAAAPLVNRLGYTPYRNGAGEEHR